MTSFEVITYVNDDYYYVSCYAKNGNKTHEKHYKNNENGDKRHYKNHKFYAFHAYTDNKLQYVTILLSKHYEHTIYYENDKIYEEEYYRTDLDSDLGWHHREDGPARITYDDDGNIELEEYHLNGKLIPYHIVKQNPNILTDKALQKILL